MKIQKPATEIEICDLCHRENQFLQICWICGKEFCLACQGRISCSYGFTRICGDCATRRDAIDICERYAKRLTPIFQERDAKLKKLRKRKIANTKG